MKMIVIYHSINNFIDIINVINVLLTRARCCGKYVIHWILTTAL